MNNEALISHYTKVYTVVTLIVTPCFYKGSMNNEALISHYIKVYTVDTLNIQTHVSTKVQYTMKH